MSRKPLQQEIDQTKTVLSEQLSHQKTTLKDFAAYYKEFNAIIKSAIEGFIKLSRRNFTCREFENNTIKGAMDNGVIFALKTSDLLGQIGDKVRLIEIEITKVYRHIKDMKEDQLNKVVQLLIQQLNDVIKKDRDLLYDKMTKSMDQRAKAEFEAFTEKSIATMASMIEQAQISERSKNNIVKEGMQQFLDSQLKFIDTEKTVLTNYLEYFNNLPLEEPILREQKKSLTRQQSQSQVKSIPLPTQDRKNDENILQSHKIKLTEIRNQYALNLLNTNMPQAIKQQVGIFNSEMPNQIDIAKEFSQQDFYLLILLLLMEYHSNHEDWPTFLTHVKNKFKVSISTYKQLECLHKRIQSEDDVNNLLQTSYSSVIKKVLKSVAFQYQGLKEEPQFKFIRKLILFQTVNEFWSQYLLPIIFQTQMYVNKDDFVAQFNKIIDQLIFKESELNIIKLFQGQDITYPLTQCILELLLGVIVDKQNLDLDYLELIQKFAQDTLKITPAHACVTLLSQVYQNIIQPALNSDSNQIFATLKGLDKAIESIQQQIQQEQGMNSTPVQRMLRLKNCEKLFSGIVGLFTNFWATLPSDPDFLKAFYRLLLVSCTIQLEFTSFNTIKELITKIMQQTGHNFYQFILKRHQQTFNGDITNDSLSQVARLFPDITKETLDLKVCYIDKMAQSFCQVFQETSQNTSAYLFSHFIQGVLMELLAILNQIDKCQSKALINEDVQGYIFVICYEIASLDDQMAGYSIMGKILQQLGPQLEVWFQTIQVKVFTLLSQCVTKETFFEESLPFKQQMELKETKNVQDFCSLLFKSIEALQNIFKLGDTSEFKKLMMNRMESILYQSVVMYLEQLEVNVKQWADNGFNGFQALKQVKQQFVVDEKKIAQQQVHLTIQLMMRICNIHFIQQQLEHFKYERNFQLIDNLNNDFSTKGKLICKHIASILCNEIIQPNLFQPMYKDLKTLDKPQDYQHNSEWSIGNLIREVQDFFLIFNQKLPSPYVVTFYDVFVSAFFKKYYYAIIDINKLQNVNLSKYSQLVNLDSSSLLKLFQKFVKNDIIIMRVGQQISEIKETALWFDLSSQDLIKLFEEQNMLNNKSSAAGLYRIMMIRKSDSKLKDVVKKYQKVYE